MKASTKEKYGKVLYRLEKIKARNYCLFQESSEDEWFIYVRKLDLKTHKETDCSMIIAKDIPQWMSSLENSGWVQKDIT
jgi:L-rhamnose mutarotase